MEQVTNTPDHVVICHGVLNTFTSMCRLIPLSYEFVFNIFDQTLYDLLYCTVLHHSQVTPFQLTLKPWNLLIK